MKYYTKKVRVPSGYSMAKAILDILFDLGERPTAFMTPYQHFRKMRRFQMAGSLEVARWRYNRAIRYLQERKQIKLSKKGGDVFLKLTRKGKLQALLDKIKDKKTLNGQWDRKWRLVIWDIPESSRKARNQIRYFLKNLGFCRLQFSVFIRPYPIPRAAVDYLKESGLIKYIRFLRVDKVDDQRELLKHYSLPRHAE